MRSRRVCIATILLFAAACDIVEPSLDPNAERVDPPTVYRRWWTMVESCSGLTGSFDRVKWYHVPNSDVVTQGDDVLGGYWAPVSNSIVLAGNLDYYGKIVRHEMLHALVKQTKGHSRQYFIDRCGGIVSCGSGCAADVGPAPSVPADVARVPSSVLEIHLSVIPAEPSPSVDGGIFTIAVTATNPKPYPVAITLDPKLFGRSFFYTIYGTGPVVTESELILDSNEAYFGPGETKQTYFDLSLRDAPGAYRLSPGHYDLNGGYDVNFITLTGLVLPP